MIAGTLLGESRGGWGCRMLRHFALGGMVQVLKYGKRRVKS